MGKIFIDTEIFGKKWFRVLPPEYKTFWFYLLARSDRAGLWEPDLDLAEFQIGVKIDPDKALEIFGQHIIVLDDGKWWLTTFCAFQYGELRESCNPHRDVIRRLDERGLRDWKPEPEPDPEPTPEPEPKPEKKKAKAKKTKDTDKANEIRDLWNENLKTIGKRKINDAKSATVKWINRRLKEHNADKLTRCVNRYWQEFQAKGTDPKYIYKVTNFFGEAAKYEIYLPDEWEPDTTGADRKETATTDIDYSNPLDY